MKPPDLVAIHGGGTKNESMESLRRMRENLPAIFEFHAIDAQVKRAKYLALVKEGFTDAQALELCK